MKFEITCTEIVNIDETFNESAMNEEDVLASFENDVLDNQDSEHETSDNKYTYTPLELVNLKVRKL